MLFCTNNKLPLKLMSPYTGRGLRVQHFRQNEECGVTEELPPVNENLHYDFNFQVFLKITLRIIYSQYNYNVSAVVKFLFSKSTIYQGR